MMYNQYTEQEIVLDLSKKVRKYLELTRSDDGWLEFEKILRLFRIRKISSASDSKSTWRAKMDGRTAESP